MDCFKTQFIQYFAFLYFLTENMENDSSSFDDGESLIWIQANIKPTRYILI